MPYGHCCALKSLKFYHTHTTWVMTRRAKGAGTQSYTHAYGYIYVCPYECKYVHVACITPAVLSIFLTPLIYGIIGYTDLILSDRYSIFVMS